MSSRNQNIVTRDDIKDINEEPEENKSNTITKVIKIIAFILVIGLILYVIHLLITKTKYSYTDDSGKIQEVSVNFSKEDLNEVYEELSEIPLEI